MDDKTNRLTDAELSEAVGGIAANSYPEPLYAVGAKLQRRDDPNSFGSVIQRKCMNGQWIYTIMGSDLKPIDTAEKELQVKSR